MNEFLQDVWRGLNATPKYLDSKYFYDEKGDELFREIMACPEYYLTRCELEICFRQGRDIATMIYGALGKFDVVELGAGDASKSIFLLRALMDRGVDFTYYPIDISSNVISLLNENMPDTLPGLDMHGLNGDYFAMLDVLRTRSKRPKVILFLGSSIGNIHLEDTVGFFTALRSHLAPGDMVLTGFDLKKDPAVILAAYNDGGGITRHFNLNLLERINMILTANFDVSRFAHKPEYDERTGACKSYLESMEDQDVRIADLGTVHFKKGEQIFMEVSQKYTVEQTDEFARDSGYDVIQHYYDSRHWFLDALWQVSADGSQQGQKAERNVQGLAANDAPGEADKKEGKVNDMELEGAE